MPPAPQDGVSASEQDRRDAATAAWRRGEGTALAPVLDEPRLGPGGHWELRHRFAEGGRWRLVARAETLAGIHEELLGQGASWSPRPEPGDRLLLTGLGRDRSFWVGDDGGFAEMPVTGWTFDREAQSFASWLDWQDAWNDCTRADWMLQAAAPHLSHGELVRATRAVADFARPHLPEGPLQDLYDEIDAWLRGEREASSLADPTSAAYFAAGALPWGSLPSKVGIAVIHTGVLIGHAAPKAPERPDRSPGRLDPSLPRVYTPFAQDAATEAATVALALRDLYETRRDHNGWPVPPELTPATVAAAVRQAVPFAALVPALLGSGGA